MQDEPAVVLRQAIEEKYGLRNVTLTSLLPFESTERKVYQVHSTSKESLLCRAYRMSPQKDQWLAERAQVLQFLEIQHYPAPRVVLNRTGATITHFEGWHILMLTFIEGAVWIEEPADLTQIGAALARLHLVDVDGVEMDISSLPNCRWQPDDLLISWRDALIASETRIPEDLMARYQFCLDTLSAVIDWPVLPTSILHCDCNSANAVHTPEGGIVLIDWDGAGLGPAVMDLGYLILNCHVGQKTWPEIIPDRTRIRHVIEGYCQHRTLTNAEKGALSSAISLAECHHNAQEIPAAVLGDWRNNRGLTRFHKRYEIVPQIADIAMETLAG